MSEQELQNNYGVDAPSVEAAAAEPEISARSLARGNPRLAAFLLALSALGAAGCSEHCGEKPKAKIADSAIHGKENYAWVGDYHEGRALVEDKAGNQFHIGLDGKRFYEENYAIAGNYHEGRARVGDKADNQFHIGLDGKRFYEENYAIAGDYYEGRALVEDKAGNQFHIGLDGKRFYEENYVFTRDYHEGRARVGDKAGNWFYIDLQGRRIGE